MEKCDNLEKARPVARRLFLELERLGLSSTQVSRATGVMNQSFTKMRNGTMNPSRAVLDRICAEYPEVDRLYIELGARNGEPAKPEKPAASVSEPVLAYSDNVVSLLQEQIRQQQKMIDHLMGENMKLMDIIHRERSSDSCA